MDPDVGIAELPQQPTQTVGVTLNVANGIVSPLDQGPLSVADAHGFR
ncbi:hypothetical protein [Bradyrhizobium sp.]